MNLSDFTNHLDDLIQKDPGLFMNLSYTVLTKFPENFLDDKSIPNHIKREGILKIINFFEKNEEYEKCLNLKSVLNMIND